MKGTKKPLELCDDNESKVEGGGLRMHQVTHDTPPKPYPETNLGLTRAADVLRVVNDYRHYFPVTARSVFYKVITSPLSTAEYWMSSQGARAGLPLLNMDQKVIEILKYLRLSHLLEMRAINDDSRIVTAKRGSEDLADFIHSNARYIFPTYIQCNAGNQEKYIEVWVEKNGLVHIAQRAADKFCRRTVGCKGFQSVPLLHQYAGRAAAAREQGQIPVILYAGDCDPSGWLIPKVIKASLKHEHGCDVDLYRIGINPDQVDNRVPIDLKGKKGLRKTFTNETGLTVGYELDSIVPEDFEQLVYDAIEQHTDMTLLECDDSVGDRINDKIELIERKMEPIILEECRRSGLIG